MQALLQRRGVNFCGASWSVNSEQFSPERVASYILERQAEITDVALGAFVWNERAIQTILTMLRKENFNKRIILGGPQISYVEKNGLEGHYPKADVFIRGYAEEALAELMLRPDKDIPGVHFANTEDKARSAQADLENLPSPFLTGIIPPQRFLRWETQRGCPFRCAFCQHRESDARNVRRQHNTGRIEAEARWITEHPIIQDIAVLDPTFNSGPQYLRTLDYLAEGRYSGKIALQCRLEMMNTEFLDRVETLNKTGTVVLECGLQTIHKAEQQAIDRPNNMRAVARSLAQIRARSIQCEVSLIYGLPHQTLASFQQSIAFCQALGVRSLQAFPLMLLRGTPLWARRHDLGLIQTDDIDPGCAVPGRLTQGLPHVIASPSFSVQEWLQMAEIAAALPAAAE